MELILALAMFISGWGGGNVTQHNHSASNAETSIVLEFCPIGDGTQQPAELADEVIDAVITGQSTTYVVVTEPVGDGTDMKFC